jgi:hypothetical protein
MTENLPNAARADLLHSTEYAVKFNASGKATNAARDYVAVALAARVLDHLERCGYVITKRPPMKWHSTT